MRLLSFACIGAALAACASTEVPVGPFGVASGGTDDAGISSGDGATDPMEGTDAGVSGKGNTDSGTPYDDGGTGSQSDAGDPDVDTPTVCTSGKQWTGGDTGSSQMHPGVACITCHVLGGQAAKKTFDIGGTVYPTAHEPDDCYGASGATVVITDANGSTHSFSVNSAGNFYNQDFFGFAAIAKPYRAKVVNGGKEREMIAAQTDGDCNKCHTEQGTSSAPGRIMLP